MLESIKVTERLHWPELEMSKKYVLNSTDKPVSPSQVYLEKISSHVLKDLFTTGTSSYNVLLQAEEEERPSPKHSPYRRPKTSVKCASTLHKRNRPGAAPHAARAGGGDSIPSHRVLSVSHSNLPKPARSITVLGSTMGLSPRPVPHPRKVCVPNSSRTKLPSLPKSAIAREADNAKKLCILTAIKPSNVEKEKVKFFKSDFNYNPQFEYSNPVSPLVLARHNNASDRFLTQAVRIMELALQRYGNYEKFEQTTGGNLLSKSRIWYNVKKYMEKEGCMGEIVVHVTDDLLSRASMTVVNGRPTLTINISTAREHWLEGMLRHEIGTHYFRGINNSQQPWSSGAGRKKHNLRPLNPTEEGLASIHSVLFRKDPTLWRAALLYYTVYQASHMSFSQLFHDLGRFVQDPNTRWDYCVRAKRGQTNTAQPGCFSKDQVYLDGILKILRHRDKIDFPLLMALGKVSFEDVDRLKGLAQMESVRIPHFLQDQASYAEQLEKIMEVNRLTDEELRVIV
ncbi:putative tyrosine carboxypeptidase MATCAP2 [Centroberyx affinis]|uniref:putative tyrosine carboxypeptidase MATCAP2 n=1 Tax=Centroberyx affinis TaxID=166261 RepID=UPI003A5C6BC2